MIDYVVPMVFPQDKEWRKNFTARGTMFSEHNNDFVRYRSWGTEELLVRCVRHFMPWVKTIHILVAQESQKKWMPWVQEIPNVQVVTHAEFIPKSFLPTFNSRAIEMFLHRIPNISDYFLYGNDDMFPLSPLKQTDFFQPSTLNTKRLIPCQHMNEKPLPERINNFQQACLAGLNFVAAEFDKHFDHTLLRGGHTIVPICRSSCLHLWERGKKEIEKSISPFRLAYNFNQYIYSWYQHFTGEYIDFQPPHPYAGVKKGLSFVLQTISEPDCGIVCINDHETCSDWKHFAEQVKKGIENKLKQI